jgi:hypothetical protein
MKGDTLLCKSLTLCWSLTDLLRLHHGVINVDGHIQYYIKDICFHLGFVRSFLVGNQTPRQLVSCCT